MTLEPRKAEDEEWKAFLVHGSHGEGEWCCDVRDSAGFQWLFIKGLDRKRRGEQVRGDVQEGDKGLVDKIPSDTRVH